MQCRRPKYVFLLDLVSTEISGCLTRPGLDPKALNPRVSQIRNSLSHSITIPLEHCSLLKLEPPAATCKLMIGDIGGLHANAVSGVEILKSVPLLGNIIEAQRILNPHDKVVPARERCLAQFVSLRPPNNLTSQTFCKTTFRHSSKHGIRISLKLMQKDITNRADLTLWLHSTLPSTKIVFTGGSNARIFSLSYTLKHHVVVEVGASNG